MKYETPLVVILIGGWFFLSIGLAVVILRMHIHILKICIPDWPPGGAFLFIKTIGFYGYTTGQRAELKLAGDEKLFIAFSRQRYRCALQIALAEIALFASTFGILVPLLHHLLI